MQTFGSEHGSVVTFRMSEVVSAMSYALDIVEGQPEGHAVRSCMIGMRIAEHLGLSAEDRSSLFYALLLKDLGCSSNAAKICYLFGADDKTVKEDFKTTDWPRFVHAAAYALRNIAPRGPLWLRATKFATLAAGGQRLAKQLVRIRCERGADIARELGLAEDTVQAIRNLDEHWNGRGHPDGLRRHEIPLLARIVSISQTTEVFARRDGLRGACDMVEERSGAWFDPHIARAFLAIRKDTSFWEKFGDELVRHHTAEYEPRDHVMMADEERLDSVAEAFAQVVDAKSPWTACHSKGVADIAVGVAGVLGLPAADIRRLRRAALLHDIGKLGISNMILNKPGGLTAEEYEEMKLHAAYTLRILERAECFRDIAEVAASHHERLDGRGYFRGLAGGQLCVSTRILAVSDMCEALSAKRPYRRDLGEGEVLQIIARESGAGVCPRVFEALRAFLARSSASAAQGVAA